MYQKIEYLEIIKRFRDFSQQYVGKEVDNNN